jgi:hypothetical protein
VVQPIAGSTRRGRTQSNADPIPYSKALAMNGRRRRNSSPTGHEQKSSRSNFSDPSCTITFTAIPYDHPNTIFPAETHDFSKDPNYKFWGLPTSTHPPTVLLLSHTQTQRPTDHKSNYPDEWAMTSMTQPLSRKPLNDSYRPPSTPSVSASGSTGLY